jgi:hypothetical protein
MLNNPVDVFRDRQKVIAGVNSALRDVRLFHKRMGVPMVGMEDGLLVTVLPEDIVLDGPAMELSTFGAAAVGGEAGAGVAALRAILKWKE